MKFELTGAVSCRVDPFPLPVHQRRSSQPLDVSMAIVYQKLSTVRAPAAPFAAEKNFPPEPSVGEFLMPKEFQNRKFSTAVQELESTPQCEELQIHSNPLMRANFFANNR